MKLEKKAVHRSQELRKGRLFLIKLEKQYKYYYKAWPNTLKSVLSLWLD